MLKYVIEVVGWLGAVLMLSAYFLLTVGKMKAHSRLYQGLNVLAGAGVIINSAWNGAYPSVFINLVWIVIGMLGLLRPASRGVASDAC
jgi:hypothetical protein